MFYYAPVTMAKSITKNTSANEAFDVEKIRRFATDELAKLSHGNLPFCYQIGATVLIVGKYKVIKHNDKCWSVMDKETHLFDFFVRKDAIFYCIALHKKDHALAQEIKENDYLLGQLDFDAILYRYRYKRAQETNDYWNLELYSSRYTETMLRMEHIKKQLKKSLNSAKYIKI